MRKFDLFGLDLFKVDAAVEEEGISDTGSEKSLHYSKISLFSL